ncbi:MAG: hypothetical protein AAFN93_30090 [Bacteroidota bacterium]
MFETNEFSLRDILSDRIYDEPIGWRDRTDDEIIWLTEDQVDSAYDVLTRRAHQNTRYAIGKYLNNPRDYPSVTTELGNYAERLVWNEWGFQLVAGQDYPSELNWVRGVIRKFVV